MLQGWNWRRGILFAGMMWQLSIGVCWGGHIHDGHPTTLHDKNAAGQGWVRISMTDGPGSPIPVALTASLVDVIVTRRFENYNKFNVTASVSETESRTHTVTVGGGIEVGGAVEAEAGVLFSKLKATAEAKVELNASYSNTWSQEINVTTDTTLAPCETITYSHTMVKKTATGAGSVYDHMFVCQHTGTGTLETRYCNKVTLSGSATGYSSEVSKWHLLGTLPDCQLEANTTPPNQIPGSTGGPGTGGPGTGGPGTGGPGTGGSGTGGSGTGGSGTGGSGTGTGTSTSGSTSGTGGDAGAGGSVEDTGSTGDSGGGSGSFSVLVESA